MRTVNYRPTNLIGPQLRKLRYQQRLSQAALVIKCQMKGWNLSRQALSKIEAKIRSVTDYELIGLAMALNVPFELLLPPRNTLDTEFKKWLKATAKEED